MLSKFDLRQRLGGDAHVVLNFDPKDPICMSTTIANDVPNTMENWDEDFEFQPTQSNTRRSTSSFKRKEVLTDDVAPLSRDTKNTLNTRPSLQHWAEAGPSTPSKRVQAQTENWDDDFQDMADLPLKQNALDSSPRSQRSRRVRPAIPEPENWDDDFEESKPGSPSGRSARWESSSEEDEYGFGERDEDRTVTSRSRRGALPRASLSQSDTPPPPVPPIPTSLAGSRLDPAPFPGSPTMSTFSVPVSGRDSVAAHSSYSSTAHLALRPTTSGSSFGGLPPSPPIHHARERRRLRKKSRPARVDYNIYEMVEPIVRPVTPEQFNGNTSGAGGSPTSALPESTPQSAGKSSLVSRIGSVGKKWGAARRKRASTGPEEVVSREHEERPARSRPTSMAFPSTGSSPPSAGSSSKGWFFRPGGVLGAGSRSPPSRASALPLPLKHEKSVDRLLSLVGMGGGSEYETPSKTRTRRKERDKGRDVGREEDVNGSSEDWAGTSSDGHGVPPAFPLSGSAHKRPASSYVPSSARRPARAATSRHASYNHPNASSSRSSLASRSASDSVENLALARKKSLSGSFKTPKKPPRNSAEGERARKSSLKSPSRHKQSSDGARPSTSTSGTAVPRSIPDRSDDATPRPPSRIMGRTSTEQALLPPIELQPPSPPRAAELAVSQSLPLMFVERDKDKKTPVLRLSQSSPLSLSPMKLIPLTTSISPNTSPSRTRSKTAASPQSASLGRSTPAPKEGTGAVTVPRRNSLGDLKIPARITQAQVGLKRNLGMVREFAANIDRLKDLLSNYHSLVSEVQVSLVETLPPDPHPLKARAASPTLFGLPRPASRARSHTNPQFLAPPSKEEARHRELVVALRTIETRYGLSWECAELLIDLGNGPPLPPEQDPGSPDAETSASATQEQSPPMFEALGRKSRERAVTLAGDEPKPQFSLASVGASLSHSTLPAMSPSASGASQAQWRASTGRHELSQRQLMLLRDMLNSPDASVSSVLALESRIEEEVNRTWRWGAGGGAEGAEAMNSTLTLPTEESAQSVAHSGVSSAAGSATGKSANGKKRASSRLGMRGLRDMLRSLKKTYTDAPASTPAVVVPQMQGSGVSPAALPVPLVPPSSTSVSISTDSSIDLPSSHSQTVAQRRRAKTSVGPESVRSLNFRDQHQHQHQHHPNSPYATTSFTHRASPRRPSLASIFRLGQKGKGSAKESVKDSPRSVGSELPSDGARERGAAQEEEWDHVGSSSDIDLTSACAPSAASTMKAANSSTVKARGAGSRARSPYLLQSPTGGGGLFKVSSNLTYSRSSIWSSDQAQDLFGAEQAGSPPLPIAVSASLPTASELERHMGGGQRTTKLSDVHEHPGGAGAGAEGNGSGNGNGNGRRRLFRPSSRHGQGGAEAGTAAAPSPRRPRSRASKVGFAAGPSAAAGQAAQSPVQSPVEEPGRARISVAMTPDNIKPLLENAKEVEGRCHECLGELRVLLDSCRQASVAGGS